MTPVDSQNFAREHNPVLHSLLFKCSWPATRILLKALLYSGEMRFQPCKDMEVIFQEEQETFQ
jgi:hypothetical protein